MLASFPEFETPENKREIKKPLSESIRENIYEISQLIRKYEKFVKKFQSFKKKTQFLVEKQKNTDKIERSTLKITEILETNKNIILFISNNFETIKFRLFLLKTQLESESRSDENNNEIVFDYFNSDGSFQGLDEEKHEEKEKNEDSAPYKFQKNHKTENEENLFAFLNV